MTHTIDEIARQFDRLCPSQVDESISGNGQQEAGHIGHEQEDVSSPHVVGWYCAGGNAGHAICEVPDAAIDKLHHRLASLPDGSLDDGGIDEIVAEVGGKFVI